MSIGAGGPLVSVIVPVRDGGAYIAEALESLRRQSSKDWEAIVVDDGSVDDGPGIVASLAAQDPRFRLIGQSPTGVAAARNAGIADARSEWLLFLDADDWLADDALARLTGAIGRVQATVIHGFGVRVANGGRGHPSDLVPPSGDMFEVLSRSCALKIHACLVRSAAVIAVGGFDPSMTSCEDWDLWQRLARAGGTFHAVPHVVAFYRQRPDSISARLPETLQNGFEVIQRAHRPDARVANAESRYAAGRPAEELPRKLFLHGAWICGCEIGAEGDVAPLLGAMAGLRLPDLSAHELLPVLLDGIAVGRRDYAPDWAAWWTAVWPRLLPLIESLEGLADSPHLAAVARRLVARQVAERLEPTAMPFLLDRLIAVTIDVADPIADVVPPPGVDRAYCVVTHRGEDIGAIEAPALSRVTGAWLRNEIEQRYWRAIFERELRRPSARFLRRGVVALLGRRGRQLGGAVVADLRRPGISPRRAFRLAVRRHLLESSALIESALPMGPAWHERLRALHDEETSPAAGASRDRWEEIFAAEDPWSYSSGYEQTKYERTLALLPDAPIARALELACAEGHFTVQLAPRVGSLLATDISETALRRAAQRCTGVNNIEFRRLDLAAEAIPGEFDLIVCSEVLYFMGGEAGLAAAAEKIAGALAPGGTLLTAHARTCADEPYVTAFEWGPQIGARTIAAALATTGSLVLEKEIRTPLYLVQRYRRIDPVARALAAPEIVELPLPREELTRELRQMVRSRGPGNQPASAGTTESLPILMYHRIAEDAPPALRPYAVSPEAFDAQLALLRRSGRHAIALDDWRRAIAKGLPLPGKPVLLTFDDGYRDFHDTAWPILRRHGMIATVFLVAGRLGGVADWDRRFGAPAPLLSPEQIRELRDEGIDFGSHGVSHTPMTGLTTEELVREGIRSRAVLERHLRFDSRLLRTVTAIAYPHGDQDPVVRYAMRECGFDTGFSTWPGWARIDGDPLCAPRIEVSAGTDLAAFAAALAL